MCMVYLMVHEKVHLPSTQLLYCTVLFCSVAPTPYSIKKKKSLIPAKQSSQLRKMSTYGTKVVSVINVSNCIPVASQQVCTSTRK
jgi:hypothetical protein